MLYNSPFVCAQHHNSSSKVSESLFSLTLRIKYYIIQGRIILEEYVIFNVNHFRQQITILSNYAKKKSRNIRNELKGKLFDMKICNSNKKHPSLGGGGAIQVLMQKEEKYSLCSE